MSALLSIAFMSCNRAGHVARSLGSVLAQTVDDIDVIVSDDCSTDGTFEKLQAIVGRYRGGKRIRLRRNEQRLGVVGHFNAIMAEAQSDYVMFAHDDDVSEPARAAQVIAAIRESAQSPSAVFHNLRSLDEDGNLLDLVEVWPRGMSITPETVAETGLNIVGAVATYARHTQDVFGPVPLDASIEDAGALFRAALLGNVVLLNEALVGKRTHAASLSGRSSILYGGGSGEATRKATIAFIESLRRVPDGWLRDLTTWRDRMAGDPVRAARIATLIEDLQERVASEIALLERQPKALLYWSGRVLFGRLSLRQFVKMLLFAYMPGFWQRYLRWRLVHKSGKKTTAWR